MVPKTAIKVIRKLEIFSILWIASNAGSLTLQISEMPNGFHSISLLEKTGSIFYWDISLGHKISVQITQFHFKVFIDLSWTWATAQFSRCDKKRKIKHQGHFYCKDGTPSHFPAARGKGQKLRQLSGNQPKIYLGHNVCYRGTIFLGKMEFRC